MIDKNVIEQAIIHNLKTCYDPEIPVNIYDLGLIYKVTVDDEGNAYVKMTLTSPSCPVAESLPGEVREKVKDIYGVKDVYIDLVFDPPWDKDMMNEEAKLELGFL